MIVLLFVWLAGIIVVLYPMYLAFLSDVRKPDTEDKVSSVFFAAFFSLLWPIILIGLALYLASHRIWVGHWVPVWLSKALKRTPQDAT